MTGSGFKDHFSDLAADYARFRPRYPPALFDWLVARCARREQAWDAGTGNGQAALQLAARFDKVLATDASAEQIAHAAPHPGIEYRVAVAEASGLSHASCDLVTAAQALHWFDVEKFFAEVQRVLRPGGLVAVWTYVKPALDDAATDAVLQEYAAMVKEAWPPERRHAEAGYRALQFPFEEIAAPGFQVRMTPTLDELAGYLRTWSATRCWLRSHGGDPVAAVQERLAKIWPAGERRRMHWPLHLRAGRRR